MAKKGKNGKENKRSAAQNKRAGEAGEADEAGEAGEAGEAAITDGAAERTDGTVTKSVYVEFDSAEPTQESGQIFDESFKITIHLAPCFGSK